MATLRNNLLKGTRHRTACWKGRWRTVRDGGQPSRTRKSHLTLSYLPLTAYT